MKSKGYKASIGYGIFVGFFYSLLMTVWYWWKDELEWWMFFFHFIGFGFFMGLFHYFYLKYKSEEK